MSLPDPFWSFVRDNIIGRDALIRTPFGLRKLTYADYTASARGVRFIEEYLARMLELYGNTHTEDDATGEVTGRRLRLAETAIKRLLGAGDCYKIIEDGTGTTGAVHRLQQILGIYLPPAGRDMYRRLGEQAWPGGGLAGAEAHFQKNRPVVFVGPYEHHSNEVSWRECFAEVVEIDLDADGLLDLADLERKVSRPEYRPRRKVGAFSAGSNVSGLLTPVFEVARILHRHDALAFFDYAAVAPYAPIRVCQGEDRFLDGIYFSPHKLLGGPGSSGILIIHERVYRHDLPPTIGAGGTVEFVNLEEQEYSPDIAAHPSFEVIGNPDPARRTGILSFNLRAAGSYLHPRFVTRLLNDLFGIQSRAGCSCAGPYGHRVLGIGLQKSLEFKREILHGHVGLKPGWARVNFHFLMSEEEFDFLCQAILFVADHGIHFLPLYRFDLASGSWRHRGWSEASEGFGLEEALASAASGAARAAPAALPEEGELYRSYLAEAGRLASGLERSFREADLRSTERSLIPFLYADNEVAEGPVKPLH
jgi:selenocysteine lyase/cysteine desulfurase